ncbi:Phototropin [Balamuthia mandrillaris]
MSKEIKSNLEVVQANSVQISEKDLLKLQKRITAEYPFISNVYESMVVTDVELPDNPIVFANDNFQRMTLYPREEIIGRNCRFLQGKHSNKETVRKIREAIVNGEKLEVELLNYRKDGVPFWNNFVLLPVHRKKQSKGKKGGKVTHFIAIQKDVTVLKQAKHPNPKRWSCHELSLFLSYCNLGHYMDWAVEHNVSGQSFRAMTEEQLSRLGVHSAKDRLALLDTAHLLKRDPKAACKVLYQEKDELASLLDDGFSSSSGNSEAAQPEYPDEAGLDYSEPMEEEVDLIHPRNLKFWKDQPTFAVTCVKFIRGRDIQILNLPAEVSLEEVQRRAADFATKAKEPRSSSSSSGFLPPSLTYEDPHEGDDGRRREELTSEAQFQEAKRAYHGRTLNLWLN